MRAGHDSEDSEKIERGHLVSWGKKVCTLMRGVVLELYAWETIINIIVNHGTSVNKKMLKNRINASDIYSFLFLLFFVSVRYSPSFQGWSTKIAEDILPAA